ncbi:MAG TPA: efflux RND transporter periplasmic adaptor subunit [Bryobacteraceae bacterium]|jgi:multidrug efflux system membrane fusion protein
MTPHPPAPDAAPDAVPGGAKADASSPRRRSRRGWWIVILLLLAAACGYEYWRSGRTTASATSDAKAGKKGGGDAVPVVGARARKGNIGVYDPGLGNVTPIYTDTIKSRVDGQLMSVRYKEGEVVQKGDPLFEIDPKPYEALLAQAEGQLARDQALLANARIDQARYETLVPQKAVPEQTLATQKALVAQYEGVVRTDQGQVDAAKVNLDYCHIPAPITGLVGLRLVDPGNIVHAADTNGLVVITQMDPISVIFTLSEDLLPAVLQKMRAGQTLEVDAYDRNNTKKLSQGTLTTVDNEIDQTTGTVRMRATFSNKDFSLFPSQFVNVRVLVQQKNGVVLLNTAGIQRNSNATFVYLVQPDSTVTLRNIQVGTTEGDDTEITSGLEPGDVVVMTGADKLQEGSKVNVQVLGEAPQAKPPSKSAPAPAKATAPGGKG